MQLIKLYIAPHAAEMRCRRRFSIPGKLGTK